MVYLFGLDDDFAMPGGVAMASLDRHLSADDRIFVFHLGLSRSNLDSLAGCISNARLEHIDCRGMLDESWVPPGHITSATYLRFLAADLLKGIDTCVYLDGDVLVRRDPRALLGLDVSKTLAAVQSRVAPWLASAGGVVHWFEAGLPSRHPYFNAGVLVLNLQRWRRNETTDHLTEYLRQYGHEILHGDQEAMNAVLCGDWQLLDRTWNYITHVSESFLQQPEAEPVDPHIVHFAGMTKPWSFGKKPLFAEEWYEVLEHTPWRGWTPSAPTPPSGARAQVRRVARAGFDRLRHYLSE